MQCIRKRVSILSMILVILGNAIQSYAQEYKVESFEIAPKDLSARTEGRVDENGRKCAVIKVYVKDAITDTDGPVVGEIRDRGMEKWIYVSHDARQVGLLFKEHMPLSISFVDYNYPSLTGQMTYLLKLNEVSNVDNDNNYQTSSQITNTATVDSNESKFLNPKDAVINKLVNKFSSLYNVQLGLTTIQDVENNLDIVKIDNSEDKIRITTKDETDIKFDINGYATLITIDPRKTKKGFPDVGDLSWKSSYKEWNDWFVSNGFEYQKYDPYYMKQAMLIHKGNDYELILMFDGGEKKRDWFSLIISKKEE